MKEIRNRGDETARIVMAHLQEGQEPPSTLKRDFEHLLELVNLTLSLQRPVLSSAENLCKQFGPRSGPT